MTVRTQAVLLCVLGLVVGRTTLNDSYLRYVKPAMQPWLLLAGLVLLAVGVAAYVVDRRQRSVAHRATETADLSGHGHEHTGLRIGWLVLVPLFAIVFIAPPALQSYSATHSDPLVYGSGSKKLGPLPAGEVVDLSLRDYAQRSVLDSGTLSGRRVRVEGFAVPGLNGSSWSIARMVVFCCAADGRSVVVAVQDSPSIPPRNTWVRVTGTWRASPDGAPVIAASSVTPIPAPANPYL